MSNKNFVVRNGITVGSWNLVNEQGNVNANTLTLSSGFPTLNVGTLTANTITVSYYGNITANTVTANSFGNVTANSYSYADGTGPGFNYLLDDISVYFNGTDTTFNLSSYGVALTPNNPLQLDIKVGNLPVFPLVNTTDYFNLAMFDVSIQKALFTGYTISGSTITFSSPPAAGMNFYGVMRTNNDKLPAFTTKYTPFSPLNMMFSY